MSDCNIEGCPRDASEYTKHIWKSHPNNTKQRPVCKYHAIMETVMFSSIIGTGIVLFILLGEVPYDYIINGVVNSGFMDLFPAFIGGLLAVIVAFLVVFPISIIVWFVLSIVLYMLFEIFVVRMPEYNSSIIEVGSSMSTEEVDLDSPERCVECNKKVRNCIYRKYKYGLKIVGVFISSEKDTNCYCKEHDPRDI